MELFFRYIAKLLKLNTKAVFHYRIVSRIMFYFIILFISCSKEDDNPVTPKPEDKITVTDIDGNLYSAVTIGSQVWTTCNLKVTHYRNGDPIPNVTEDMVWHNLHSGAYCNYNNDPTYSSTYGRFYNWFAVTDSRGLAPQGWHVPTDEEWQTLITFLGGSEDGGGYLKQTGTALWAAPNTGAGNEFGFNALPAGYRTFQTGKTIQMGYLAIFWSATIAEWDYYAWQYGITHSQSTINRNYGDTSAGYSVRCVRD
ncbi:MAG TPA: fibrobacter succinogenes major paralogous domain-containing protein [bacterium]|nr:fibrobacter succinogenes major paralogous domain-containing protein [bacterium]HPN45300.1 fibrobacter succinogenes major paralogous domain-containing protein [bacterium]